MPKSIIIINSLKMIFNNTFRCHLNDICMHTMLIELLAQKLLMLIDLFIDIYDNTMYNITTT